MDSIKKILENLQKKDGGKYLTHEWQLYGYRLAKWLEDEERMSLYMKLAKNENRETLQKAWDFVKESKPKSKPKLFMWKLKELKSHNNNLK